MDTTEVSVDDITLPSVPSNQPDIKTLEEVDYLVDAAHAAEIESFKQDVKHRAEYAPKIYWLVVVWVIGIFALIILQGFHIYSFNLSDSVLIAAISGTTLNILGIFAIVAKYIFRKR